MAERDAELVWLPSAARDVMAAESAAKHPLESGGVILGYWSSLNELVITTCGGPGPQSVHRRDGFKHDSAYDQRLIEDRYWASAGVETYLGTWHSHPGTRHARMSWTDRRAMRKIADEEEARAPRPLMIIMSGPLPQWQPHAFVGEVRPLLLDWRFLQVSRASIRDC